MVSCWDFHDDCKDACADKALYDCSLCIMTYTAELVSTHTTSNRQVIPQKVRKLLIFSSFNSMLESLFWTREININCENSDGSYCHLFSYSKVYLFLICCVLCIGKETSRLKECILISSGWRILPKLSLFIRVFHPKAGVLGVLMLACEYLWRPWTVL